MGRYLGPSCRQCRREKMKLFLKGSRCFMAKCAVEVGRPIPGMHGKRPGKLSNYGLQLREKQKLKRIYGVRESQFSLFFRRAVRAKGITGERLLQMLELRLDNIIFRLGFAGSRKAARQFVHHGHVLINGRKATIGSMQLKAGDIINLDGRKPSIDLAKQCIETSEGRGLVPWLSLDKENLKGTVIRLPNRDEMAVPVNEQLVVELYSK